jgi:tetratricopeptide (TPR) repeat protein
LRGWRLWTLRLLAVVAAPAVFFGCIEIGLRLAGYGYPTDYFLPCDGGAAYRPNDDFGRRFHCPEVAAPLILPAEKPAHGVRIFVLGESAAYGAPDPAFSPGRVLEVMLRSRHPNVPIEVVNTAIMGIHSHALRIIAQDCLAHQPDAWLVYGGNNELIGSCGVGTRVVHVAKGFSLPLIRSSLALERLRLGQLLDRLLLGGSMGDVNVTQDDAFYQAHRTARDAPCRNVVYDNFRENLRDIFASAKRAEVKVIASTVAVNLKDFPPLGSLHRAGLSAEEIQRWESAYREGAACEDRQRWQDAVRRFQAAAEIDDQFADLDYRLAWNYYQSGDFQQCRRHFLAACDCDAIPFRADGRINAAVREAAAQFPDDVRLVDAERQLAEADAGEHGIPGESLFCDHVHFTFHGAYELAKVFCPAVEASLGDKLGPAGDELPSEADCAAELAYTRFDRLKLADPIAALTAKPPFTGQFDHAKRQARAVEAVRQLHARYGAEDTDRDLEIYRHAIQRAPHDLLLQCNYAELLAARHDGAAAAERLEPIVKQFPSRILLRLVLGTYLCQAGKLDAARQQADEVLRRKPGHGGAKQLLRQIEQPPQQASPQVSVDPRAEELYRRGVDLIQRRQCQEAVDVLREAARLAPQNARIQNNLGAALLMIQSVDEAVVHLKTAVELSPDHCGAHRNLAFALEKQQQWTDAVGHLRRAVELGDPAAEVRQRLAWLLATVDDPAARNGAEALRLLEPLSRESPDATPRALDVLAAAYAECGRFDDAVHTAEESLRRTLSNSPQAAAVGQRLEAYRAGKPWRKP